MEYIGIYLYFVNCIHFHFYLIQTFLFLELFITSIFIIIGIKHMFLKPFSSAYLSVYKKCKVKYIYKYTRTFIQLFSSTHQLKPSLLLFALSEIINFESRPQVLSIYRTDTVQCTVFVMHLEPDPPENCHLNVKKQPKT